MSNPKNTKAGGQSKRRSPSPHPFASKTNKEEGKKDAFDINAFRVPKEQTLPCPEWIRRGGPHESIFASLPRAPLYSEVVKGLLDVKKEDPVVKEDPFFIKKECPFFPKGIPPVIKETPFSKLGRGRSSVKKDPFFSVKKEDDPFSSSYKKDKK